MTPSRKAPHDLDFARRAYISLAARPTSTMIVRLPSLADGDDRRFLQDDAAPASWTSTLTVPRSMAIWG